MAIHATFFGRAKSILGIGIIVLGTVIFRENLDIAAIQLRHLFGPIPRQAIGILPTVILAIARVWQVYGAGHQRFLPRLLQYTLVSCWPLLLVVIGTVLSRDAVVSTVNTHPKKDSQFVDSAAGRSTLE